jgi:CubicO group peptidase (beta-lactamase class C family)
METIIYQNKETIILLAVCLVLTGGNIWVHRNSSPANWETMEQYGITFKHPAGFRFSSSTPSNWIQSFWDGGVQGELTSGEMEIIGLYWITEKAETTEQAIEFIIEIAKEENLGLLIQEIKSIVVDDKKIAYCNVALEVDGMNVSGVLCAFRDSYGRIILPYHLRYPGSYDYSLQMVKKIIYGIEISPPVKPRDLTSYWPTDGWRYATPEEMGMDASLLQDMVEDIRSKPSSVQVDSVVIIKNGYIVFEEYFNDYDKDTPHIIYSCTKSVLSTIFGIAHENGAIPSLDTKLLDAFPNRDPANLDEWKEAITLRDLLMMSAGFDARDSWLYEWEKLGDLHEAPDAVDYMLDLPMVFEPGSRFEYSNGVSHLLSCIITEKTGETAAEYGQEHLFDPLGITLYQWDADNMGRNWGYNRIYITPHEMAKIGYLFLHEGEWDGEQIISANWVNEATMHRIDANLIDGYGYQWWVGEGYYTALGYMGQFIMVFPEQDLVVIYTGGTSETFDYSIQLPLRFIIPAVD